MTLTLFHVIKDVLVRCSLPIANYIGQAYDGAAKMSGVHNGLQALMKEKTNHCIRVHCFAHSFNLCVQEVARKCELLRNCIEFISQLVQLIKFSPKRLNLFESTRKEITFASDGESQLSCPALSTLCPTRWTVRHSAIGSIIKNYQALMTALKVVEQGHDDHAAKAQDLLTKIDSFDVFFSLKLAYRIFSAAEQFSINFQAKDTTVSEGIKRCSSSEIAIHINEERRIVFYFLPGYSDILKWFD